VLFEASPTSDLAQQTLEDLMAKYQQADSAAAVELIRQVSPVLFRFFANYTAIRAYAEDLVQECWLRIHRSRHTYRPGEPVRAWIFAIARHTRADGYGRRRRIESHELPVDELQRLPESGKGAPCGPDGFVADLSRTINTLPEGQREVILMLKVSGMSLEEVARATGSTIGAVKQKAHRAYQKLRETLRKDFAIRTPQ
jgi:RNA polymerase sigma-70 factor (ECF subfamily)